MKVIRAVHVDIAEYSAHDEHVHHFKVTAIGPPIHFNCQQVLSLLKVVGDVEFGVGPGVLIITDKVSIYPYFECTGYTVEMQNHLSAPPPGRDRKALPIVPHRIDLILYTRELVDSRHMPYRGQGGMKRFSIAQTFPTGWHRNLLPGAVINVRLLEPFGPLPCMFRPAKRPRSV